MLKATFVTKLIVLGLGLTALFTATPAKAAVLTYQGDTTNQPTWQGYCCMSENGVLSRHNYPRQHGEK